MKSFIKILYVQCLVFDKSIKSAVDDFESGIAMYGGIDIDTDVWKAIVDDIKPYLIDKDE